MEPGDKLYWRVRGVLTERGTSLSRWCLETRRNRTIVWRALTGIRRTAAAQKLIKTVCSELGIEEGV